MYILTDTEEIEEDTCYLNHSCLGSCSCGSLDMAWMSKSELAAEGMQARAKAKDIELFINEM